MTTPMRLCLDATQPCVGELLLRLQRRLHGPGDLRRAGGSGHRRRGHAARTDHPRQRLSGRRFSSARCGPISAGAGACRSSSRRWRSGPTSRYSSSSGSADTRRACSPLLITVSQLLNSAMRMGQSSLYRVMYPREMRGRVLGRLTFWSYLTMVPSILADRLAAGQAAARCIRCCIRWPGCAG